MKRTCLILLSCWMLSCTKDDGADKGHVQVNLCLVNKTENDFVGDSYLDIGGFKTRNLPQNETYCIGALAGATSWTAHVKFKEVEFATWVGGAALPENVPTTTTEMTNANKTFDFRDQLIGKYNFTITCAQIDTLNSDTLATTSEALTGDVTEVPKVLNLRIDAGSDFNSVVTFSEDPYNFINPEGTVGQFNSTDLQLGFLTKKITAPGIETRCFYQGKKQ